ncbi:MAG: IclR family transcriptional regulator C-terminal domain-containing protein [Xenophilus sp.]
MSERKEGGGDVGSLGKGLTVLQVLQAALQPLALSELAEQAGLTSSTAHRLVRALCDLDLAYQHPGGRYCAAPRALFTMALEHPLNVLRRDCWHILEGLRTRYGPSAKLVAFMGGRRVIVDVAIGRYNITPYFGTHDLAPLHASVSGKLLLSGLAPAERDALLGAAPYPARSPYTITERAALFAQLDEVNRTHVATNDAEHLIGVSALGVRLQSPTNRTLGAILLTGPSEFFGNSQREAMRAELLQTAELLGDTSQALRSLAGFLGC